MRMILMNQNYVYLSFVLEETYREEMFSKKKKEYK